MKLHNLKSPKPNQKTRKRLGRGQGSGLGEQSGKGHKGQKAMSGYSYKRGFEGGQMPLQRRVPKFGFTSPFRKEYTPVNLDTIQKLMDEKKVGETISKADLVNAGLASSKDLIKVLGRGELTSKVNVEVDAFSKTAVEKIEKAGGTAKTV